MPYQYLTFSDLYEEQVRSSAPSSPVMNATTTSATLHPIFLLPTAASASSSSSSHHHAYHMSSEHPSRHHHAHLSRSRSQAASTKRRGGDAHDHALLQTYTQGSEDVASPTSSTSSSHGLDFFKMFKRRASTKTSNSALSTPASSRRSSFNSHPFASLHPVSAASSANTSPAISRQVTKVSDYESLVQRTAREEQEEELTRQRELQAYFKQAAESGLSLRRF